MEKNSKVTKYIKIIVEKALHVKRLLTVDEQVSFLEGKHLLQIKLYSNTEINISAKSRRILGCNCFLTDARLDALTIWKTKEKIEVKHNNSNYTAGLFLDIEQKTSDFPCIKHLLSNPALVNNLPGFQTFHPRYLVGHIYNVDGALKPHVDGVQ